MLLSYYMVRCNSIQKLLIVKLYNANNILTIPVTLINFVPFENTILQSYKQLIVKVCIGCAKEQE